MTTSTATIDCAKCQIPLKGPANPQPDDLLTCESCGGSIKVEDALAQAKQSFVDHARKMLEDSFRKAGFR